MQQSEIAQALVTFSGLQNSLREILAWVNTMKDISVFFSNFQKRLSLLHAQVNDKCSDSSHSRLKRHCSTKRIENYDAVFVFKEFYPAVVSSLDQLLESRDGEVLGRAMPYLKAMTTAVFLVSQEQGFSTFFLISPPFRICLK